MSELRSVTDELGHRHIEADVLTLSKAELIRLDYTLAGSVRHTQPRDDEPVALGNLLACIARFCTDMEGNKYGASFCVPAAFWGQCEAGWRLRGMDPDLLPRTDDGGVMAMIAGATVYPYDGVLVLMRSDYNAACWSFEVTEEHELLRRPQIRELLGPGRGFDDRVYYLPWAGPGWGWLGYTPVPVLEEWASGGDRKAAETVTAMAAGGDRAFMVDAALDALGRLCLPEPEGARERAGRLRLREVAHQERLAARQQKALPEPVEVSR